MTLSFVRNMSNDIFSLPAKLFFQIINVGLFLLLSENWAKYCTFLYTGTSQKALRGGPTCLWGLDTIFESLF